jgi:hypothetical protein
MKHWLQVGLCALALVVGGVDAAFAQLDVQLAFDRAVANPGDRVTLSGSVTNQHELAVFAYLQVTVHLNGSLINTFAGRVPLESQEVTTSSLSFDVPSLLPGGTVTVTLAGRSCDDVALATTTLVLERAVTASGEGALRTLGQDLVAKFGVELLPVSTREASMGNVKRLFRE